MHFNVKPVSIGGAQLGGGAALRRRTPDQLITSAPSSSSVRAQQHLARITASSLSDVTRDRADAAATDNSTQALPLYEKYVRAQFVCIVAKPRQLPIA
ncbi:hypothetical protein G7K_3570-t1 [Saitoella complicata NRRL Y-17804]|uniref:Uncharacterized protein n=1 Tax=Saitoella complicata (strain BCRC 22490 / CBS 7301 / JCM 7358 / NBRC 10748 / NRRL Y-17804) TaxID=698492 RepID=A0A0E9NJ49_SAICN|nr:hypothetical protein G7K_3570-t1 [Saitoella complicata NRRL Y-17804]